MKCTKAALFVPLVLALLILAMPAAAQENWINRDCIAYGQSAVPAITPGSVSPYVLEKLRQKDAPRIEAARKECEWRKQQQLEAKAAEQSRQSALERERQQQAQQLAAEREREARERERQQQSHEALSSGKTVRLSSAQNATFCQQAIKSDRSGWVEGPYADEAGRRGLTFRACDDMNNATARVAVQSADSPVQSTNLKAGGELAQAQPAEPPSAYKPAADSPPAGASSINSPSKSSVAQDPVAQNSNWLVPLALVLLVVWLAIKYFRKLGRSEAQKRGQEAATTALMSIVTEFPFWFLSHNEKNYTTLCMAKDGQHLRFLEFDLDGKKRSDLTMPISSVNSVELAGGNELVTDYESTSTKPNALPGAIVGGLLFGKTGAIVGAAAAGSKETSVAVQRLIERPSVLVFNLSDLNHPVIRFASTDHKQCDLWLHRIRSAMATHAKADKIRS